MTIADFNIKPSARMLREFGIIALFGFGPVGALLGLKWDAWTASYVLWTLGAVSFVLGLVQPRLLLPLYENAPLTMERHFQWPSEKHAKALLYS